MCGGGGGTQGGTARQHDQASCRMNGAHGFRAGQLASSAACLHSIAWLTGIVVSCAAPAGLPVGLQVVGPPGSDALVLAEAAAFERAHSHWQGVPRDVNVVGAQQLLQPAAAAAGAGQ